MEGNQTIMINSFGTEVMKDVNRIVEHYKGEDFPDKKLKLYTIIQNGYILEQAGNKEEVITFFKSFPFDKYYLVGIDTLNQTIKFISGNYFLTKIAGDFTLKPDNPETFIKFLKIKCFNMLPNNIKFKKRKDSKLLFELYSNDLGADLIVSIDLNDYDVIEWKLKTKSHTKYPKM